MDIIAGAAGIGGVQGQCKAQQEPCPGSQAVMPSQLPQGDEGRGHHRRLQDLQGGRVGGQAVEGEHQIVDGGDVDGEMAQGAVTLHGGDGQARLLHVVEHLGKDGEIIGGYAEAQHPADGPHADKDKERRASRHSQPEIERLFLAPGQGPGGGEGPALDGVYD